MLARDASVECFDRVDRVYRVHRDCCWCHVHRSHLLPHLAKHVEAADRDLGLAVVDQWYINVSTRAVEVCGDMNGGQVIDKILPGQTVHGTLRCRTGSGRVVLRRDDGCWTTIRTKDGMSRLSPATVFDQWYICVIPDSINVRCGPELSTSVVRTIQPGDAVRGVLTCCSSGGRLRLRLEDGNWTSLCSNDGQAYFREATYVNQWYVSVQPDGQHGHRSLDPDTGVTGHIRFGQAVHGNFLCHAGNGDLRLKLDDGTWTTVASCGLIFLEEASAFEQTISAF